MEYAVKDHEIAVFTAYSPSWTKHGIPVVAILVAIHGARDW